ncbi:hypothetical protein HaLaN_22509, partial [Haematococcus lacustris]
RAWETIGAVGCRGAGTKRVQARGHFRQVVGVRGGGSRATRAENLADVGGPLRMLFRARARQRL